MKSLTSKHALYISILFLLFIFGFLANWQSFWRSAHFLSAAMVAISLPTLIAFIWLFESKRKGIEVVGLLATVLFLFEAFAVKVGFPYGVFTYADLTLPHILNTPVSMFFVWPALVISAWSIVSVLSRHRIFLVAILLVVFDLVLDPGAVAMGLWEWENTGLYFGIPLINYFGWFVFGILGAFIMKWSRQVVFEKSLVLTFAYLGNFAFWSGYLIGEQQLLSYLGIGGLIVVVLFIVTLVKHF